MRQATRASKHAFITDIDVLRAFAVMFVVYAHGFFLFPWPNSYWFSVANYIVGWPGVDLFFCISGFVIARELLIVSSGPSAQANFLVWSVPFWIKRAWRILPSAWFWSTFSLFASLYLQSLPGSGDPRIVFHEWIASLLQFVNGYYLSCNPSCGNGSVFTTVYWSLALEDQFYIVLPFVLFLLPRRWLVPFFVVTIAVQFFLNRPQAPLNVLWYMRTDAVSLGVLIAIGHHHDVLGALEPTCLRVRRYRWPVIGGLVFLLGALSLTGIAVSTGMVALLSGALVLIASFDGDYVMRGGALKTALMWIGARSFALYLVHLPAFAFTRWIVAAWRDPSRPYTDHNTAAFVLIAAVLLAALAEANFRIIERPLRRHGRVLADRVAQRSIAQGSTTGGCDEAAMPTVLQGRVR